MSLPAEPAWKKPSIAAAVLLLARRILETREAPWPEDVGAVLRLTSSSKSHAHDMRGRLEEALERLHERPGRPPKANDADTRLDVAEAVRDFLLDHPGAVVVRDERRRYTKAFQRFVVGLRTRDDAGAELSDEAFAEACGVPLGTLKDWLASAGPGSGEADEDVAGEDDTSAATASGGLTTHDPVVATIVAEWPRWSGDFTTFVDHLRAHQRIERGRTFVASILEAAGLRTPARRKPPPPPGSVGSFRKLFPGAQWIGDGTAMAVEWGDRRFVFNLEAIVDTDSNALVGVRATDTEDEQALLDTYDHGLATTDDAPVGLSVDHRPSNLTEAVEDAIAPTRLVPATPGRGQSKAPVEGAFGLFSQTAPPLRVSGDTPRERARSVLALAATLWAWARNGRPRKHLGGRSPAEHYRAARPTDEQRAQARAWMAELARRSARTRTTRARHADPGRRQLLEETLPQLGISDPDGRLAHDLAGYAAEAIERGLAIFRSKRELGTIPDGAHPGRYLGGIIRNLDQSLEIERTAEHLLELRLRHRELSLAPLQRDLERLRAQHDPAELPSQLVERALEADALIDFRFYNQAAAGALARLPERQARVLLTDLRRRVARRFGASKQRRDDLLAALTDAVVRP